MTRWPAIAILLLLSWPAHAGGHGTVTVMVRDLQGKPVADASVRVTAKDTWRKFERTTDAGGRVRFHRVPAGEFRLIIVAKSFERLSDGRACMTVVNARHVISAAVLAPLGAKKRPPEPSCPRLMPDSQVETLVSPRGAASAR